MNEETKMKLYMLVLMVMGSMMTYNAYLDGGLLDAAAVIFSLFGILILVISTAYMMQYMATSSG